MAANPYEPNRGLAFGKLILTLLVAGVITAGIAMPYVGGLGLVAGNEAGKFQNTTCSLQESKPPQRTTLLARDGKTVIATLFNQDRVPIGLSQIPQYLQDALVATEDRRFYSHHGVDMRGLIRSAVSTTGGNTQGGSTLTMQYVKQIRYYQAGDNPSKQAAAIAQNLQRKIEDARCALYIEGTLHESKGTILDNYLNIAFFGEHAFGIETAAQTYFNKPASKLTLGESALLVGMLRAPSAYDPFINRAAATQRRNEVLQNLVSVGKLNQLQADREARRPISLATQSPPQVRQGCANAATSVRNAAFFCEYTTKWLTSVGKLTDTQLQTGGLKIVTTLDPNLQNSAQQRIDQTIPATSPTTAVLPVVDPHTGDILAMATSKRYGARNSTETEQPVFTRHVAQGASTYKLFPLLTALSTGVPSDWELDTPTNTAYKSKNCATPAKVTNSDSISTFIRNETLSSATAKSSNTYFVGLADVLFGCHLTPMIDLATRLGMKGLQEPSDLRRQTVGEAVISQQRAQQFVLGSVATSPLEIAGAYAAVANHGKFNAPGPVLSITDSNGSALAVHRSPGVQVIAPQVAAQAVDVLKGDTRNEGSAAAEFTGWYAKNQSVIAGKTGTMEANQKGKNAAIWFVGMTPNLVAASALINFDASSAPSSGLPGRKPGAAYGSYASRIWLRALQPSLANKTWTWTGADAVPGKLVPDVAGMELPAANRLLQRNGFVMRQLDAADGLQCPSGNTPFGSVGYYGPQRAQAGATITVCPSLGVSQPIFVPAPVYTPPPYNPRNDRSRSRSGNGNGSGNGGGNRTGNRPGSGSTRTTAANGNGNGNGNGPTRAPGGGRNTRTAAPGG